MTDADQPPDLPPRISRLWAIGTGIVAGSLLAILAGTVLVAISKSERLPEITMGDLDSAAARWGANGPRDYDLDIEQTGVNPGQFHVEVRGGEVTDMKRDGQATRQHLWDDWSVPGLFSVIRRDVEACMPELNAKAKANDPDGPQVVPRGTFDPHDGHPTQYHRITPTGADAKWRVTKFEVK
jgi:hypothetical protein